MKIMLTGGAGYIGSVLTNILLKNNFEVFIVDNLSTGFKENINKKSHFYKEDIRNYMAVYKILKKNKIKNIIHLAAKMSNEDSIKNPIKYYDNNIMGTYNLLKACKNANIKNFIFSSSCAVYGNKGNKKVSEIDDFLPEAPYGLTKLYAEKIIKEASTNKFNYAILRYFNVIGADYQNKNGQIFQNNQLFQNIALSLLKNKTINIYGNNFSTLDGYAIRDFIDVNDLSFLHLKFLNLINNQKKNIIVNCGYGKGHSVKQIIKKFEKISQKKLKARILKKRDGDIGKSISNPKKLNNLIKWKPKFSKIEKSIQNTLMWNKYLIKKKIL